MNILVINGDLMTRVRILLLFWGRTHTVITKSTDVGSSRLCERWKPDAIIYDLATAQEIASKKNLP